MKLDQCIICLDEDSSELLYTSCISSCPLLSENFNLSVVPLLVVRFVHLYAITLSTVFKSTLPLRATAMLFVELRFSLPSQLLYMLSLSYCRTLEDHGSGSLRCMSNSEKAVQRGPCTVPGKDLSLSLSSVSQRLYSCFF